MQAAKPTHSEEDLSHAQYMVDAVDKNEDGAAQWAEIIDMLKVQGADDQLMLEAILLHSDENYNGQIEVTEMVAFMKAINRLWAP